MTKVAVVVPTIRKEKMEDFVRAWSPLLHKHNAELITVWDGDKPFVTTLTDKFPMKKIMGRDSDIIYNKNDGVRNLGFAYIAKFMPDVEYIVTLDDDVTPEGDPIADHISTLDKRVTTRWISTATDFMRGFPYEIRNESEVVLSHGLWLGVKDWDAPSQLVNGNPDVQYYVGAVPRGIYYPMCGMNIAFKRKMLPYMYYAPMGYRVGLDRFADIWLGIVSKRIVDDKGWAVYSGGAFVNHDRASNVWKNLQKEARGLELNEGFWKGEEDDPYFKEYEVARSRWEEFIVNCSI